MEAIAQRKPIAQYKPKGAAAKAIKALADEIARPAGRCTVHRPNRRRPRDGQAGRTDEAHGRPERRGVMGAGRRGPADAPSAGAGPPDPDRLQGSTRARTSPRSRSTKIDRDPDQPREEFDAEALGRLAESLRARGQLQPIRVRWDEGRGVYMIVCGERRWRAARMAGARRAQPASSSRGRSTAGRAARDPAGGERPARGPPADRAGEGVPALMDRKTAGRARQVAEELAVDHRRWSGGWPSSTCPRPSRPTSSKGLPPTTAYEIAGGGPRRAGGAGPPCRRREDDRGRGSGRA